MAESLVVEDFHQFGGKHCQTAALKNIGLAGKRLVKNVE